MSSNVQSSMTNGSSDPSGRGRVLDIDCLGRLWMILTQLGPDALFYRALTPRWAHLPESGAGAAGVGWRSETLCATPVTPAFSIGRLVTPCCVVSSSTPNMRTNVWRLCMTPSTGSREIPTHGALTELGQFFLRNTRSEIRGRFLEPLQNLLPTLTFCQVTAEKISRFRQDKRERAAGSSRRMRDRYEVNLIGRGRHARVYRTGTPQETRAARLALMVKGLLRQWVDGDEVCPSTT